MKTIITHSGGFHADDVFAVATLQLLLGVEHANVIRTRDEEVIATGDYVVDVGGVYDHEKKRYDHHQNGAPVRENDLPYAAFGLVWKHYGVDICDNETVAERIDQRLAQPIDAGDNGISLYELGDRNITPFELHSIVSSYTPVWGSEESKDEAFLEAVSFARDLLKRIIAHEQAYVAQEQIVRQVYEEAEDKRVLVFSVPVSSQALVQYEEVEVVVCPDSAVSNERWKAAAVRKGYDSFASRVLFPERWAGLRDEELQKASGIADAIFCHKARFLFVAGSREGALQAAALAR